MILWTNWLEFRSELRSELEGWFKTLYRLAAGVCKQSVIVTLLVAIPLVCIKAYIFTVIYSKEALCS